MATKHSTLNELEISSTWVLESEEKELKNSITVNTSSTSVELEDVVQLETCVHLIQANKEPCTVCISFPEGSTQLILQIVVVSEARIVELFGSCGEYLSTCTAEYVDDFEDCAVYMAECNVKPTKQLVMKFQKAKHPDRMWLYGINLTVSPIQNSAPSRSSINFQVVNDMLKDTKIPISENAEKCKAFLQAYCGASNQSQPFFKSKPPDPQLLMKMFEAEYFNPLSERGRNVSKCFSNLVPFLSKGNSEDNSTPDCEMNINKSESVDSSELKFLKNYIDKRFTDLENKIERFEQNFKELELRQNEKLDCIVALLNKLSS